MPEIPTEVSIVYTPGKRCGFHCDFCHYGRNDNWNLSQIQNLTPGDVNMVGQKMKAEGIRISQTRIAGVAGDVTLTNSFNLQELVSSMFKSLSDPDTLLNGKFPRVGLISNMVYWTEKKAKDLAPFKGRISLSGSVDQGHHGGSGLCNYPIENLDHAISGNHHLNCEYFLRVLNGYRLIASVIGVENLWLTCVNNEVFTQRRKLLDYFGIPKSNFGSVLAVGPHDINIIDSVPGTGLNDNLVFAARQKGRMKIYNSFIALLRNEPDNLLTAIVN